MNLSSWSCICISVKSLYLDLFLLIIYNEYGLTSNEKIFDALVLCVQVWFTILFIRHIQQAYNM